MQKLANKQLFPTIKKVILQQCTRMKGNINYSPTVPSSRIRVPKHLFSGNAAFAYLQLFHKITLFQANNTYKLVRKQGEETPSM